MESHYKKLREEAYRATEKVFKVSLTSIDSKSVSAAQKHKFTWDWSDDENAYIAARFEVAI